jgi:hypothetical protein
MIDALRKKIIPGCLGSFVMECLRFYKIHILGVQPDIAGSNHYLWVSGLFILSGGIVAYYWNDKNEWRSFVMGLSWPALVAAFFK